MIFTLHLLLMLALIILIPQCNFTVPIQKPTRHSTTINPWFQNWTNHFNFRS